MSETGKQQPGDVQQWLLKHQQQCNLSLDSREIHPGDIFLAIPGIQEHGLVYSRQAIEHGASAIVYDPAKGGHALAQKLAGDPSVSVCLMEQPHLGEQVGLLASSFYQHPSRQLCVIGITGTNGKTSCSHFIAQAITALNPQDAQNQCGYIGTLGWGLAGNNQPTINTTPDAVELQRILSALKQQGASAVAMEVSSHGLAQNRLQGIRISAAVFTNFGRDHLDYHQSIEHYLDSKLTLFSAMESGFAVINLDDPAANQVLATINPQVNVYGFSLRSSNHLSETKLTVHAVQQHHDQTTFEVCFRGQRVPASLPLVGEFNLANALATIGVMLGMGFELTQAVNVLQSLKAVPGRLEKMSTVDDDIDVYVDYAHTADALSVVLSTIRQLHSGQQWLVFGCGGNRNQGKRRQMGKVASQLADHLVITDDNPRYEDGEQIIRQIVTGCSEQNLQVIRDRAVAIETAILSAQPGDSVLIAGKGHETTQEINGQMIPCDDRSHAKSALMTRHSQQPSSQLNNPEP